MYSNELVIAEFSQMLIKLMSNTAAHLKIK